MTQKAVDHVENSLMSDITLMPTMEKQDTTRASRTKALVTGTNAENSGVRMLRSPLRRPHTRNTRKDRTIWVGTKAPSGSCIVIKDKITTTKSYIRQPDMK